MRKLVVFSLKEDYYMSTYGLFVSRIWYDLCFTCSFCFLALFSYHCYLKNQQSNQFLNSMNSLWPLFCLFVFFSKPQHYPFHIFLTGYKCITWTIERRFHSTDIVLLLPILIFRRAFIIVFLLQQFFTVFLIKLKNVKNTST